jgi:hypothetical protein
VQVYTTLIEGQCLLSLSCKASMLFWESSMIMACIKPGIYVVKI